MENSVRDSVRIILRRQLKFESGDRLSRELGQRERRRGRAARRAQAAFRHSAEPSWLLGHVPQPTRRNPKCTQSGRTTVFALQARSVLTASAHLEMLPSCQVVYCSSACEEFLKKYGKRQATLL